MRVKLCFSDGVEREVDVDPEETILAAAERQGVAIHNQCRSGSCSTCIGTVIAGDVEHDTSVSTALLPMEFNAGCRLSCIARPKAPSTISFDYPSVEESESPTRFLMLVDAIEPIAADVVRVKARTPKKLDFAFSPGQYLKFKVPGTEEWRCFSMSTPSADLNRMEFLIRLLPRGVMTDYLRDRAQPSDFIEVEGPLGEFSLEPSDKKHILIGGGTGVAPLLSMLRHMTASGRKRPQVLLSAGFNSPEQFFFGDIESVARWFPEIETRISLLAGNTHLCAALTGNPVEAIRKEDVDDGDVVAYLCGPPPMVLAARKHLVALGLPLTSIFFENFTAAESC